MGYLVMIIFIACVVAAMVTTGLGGQVAASTTNAICRVTLDSCKPVNGGPSAAGERGPGQVKLDGGTGVIPPGPGDKGPVFRVTPYWDALTQWLRQQGVKIEGRPGGGNVYDKTNKVLYLDPTTSRAAALSAFQEALWSAAGNQMPIKVADPKTMSHDEYIQVGVAGVVDYYSMSAKISREMREMEGGAGYPDSEHQQIYDSGYAMAVKQAEAAAAEKGRELTDAEKARIGESGGRAAIFKQVQPETVEHLERQWDIAHPKPQRDWRCLKLWHCA